MDRFSSAHAPEASLVRSSRVKVQAANCREPMSKHYSGTPKHSPKRLKFALRNDRDSEIMLEWQLE